MEKLTEEVMDRLFQPVGEIIVQWGVTDVLVHHLGFAMLQYLGKSPRDSPWPKALGHRLSLIEEMFAKRDEFAKFAKAAKAALANLRHQQTLRDMLVHGAAVRYDREKDGVLFRRMDQKTKGERRREPMITHRPKQMLVRFGVLKIASGNCVVINTDLANLHTAIRDLPRP